MITIPSQIAVECKFFHFLECMHWYCLFVRNEQSQWFASGLVRLCHKIYRETTIEIIILIVPTQSIFWQSLTKPDAKRWLCSFLTNRQYQWCKGMTINYLGRGPEEIEKKNSEALLQEKIRPSKNSGINGNTNPFSIFAPGPPDH